MQPAAVDLQSPRERGPPNRLLTLPMTMNTTSLARAAAAAAFFAALCTAQGVVINEFSYDDSGTPDDTEFVELYNASATTVDISGWLLECSDEAVPDDNPDYTIPAGTMMAPGSFYVIGAPTVPNVNLVITNPNTGLSQDLFEDGPDAITLRDASNNVVDSVVYEWVALGATSWPNAPYEGYPIWGTFVNVDFHEQTRSRLADGWDTDNNARDFVLMAATPGASNNRPNLLPYLQDFSGLMPTNMTNGAVQVPHWSGSFVEPVCIDPTALDTQGFNLNALPPSPNGGNAGVFGWDPAGGGNLAVFECEPKSEIAFDAYIYIDVSTLPVAGEYYVWSIGMCGTSGTYYNLPNVAGTFGTTFNNNTGVSWTMEVTSAGATLHLVDHNEGGQNSALDQNPLRLLGSIPIDNTTYPAGWYSIKLRASGGTVEGTFAGQTISGVVENGTRGTVYIGCREFVTNNADCHPPILDQILIYEPSGRSTPFGHGTATTLDRPAIGSNSWPAINNSGFAIDVVDMLPTTPVALLAGLSALPMPLDVSFIGTQPGSTLYLNPGLSVTVPSDGTGLARFPLPLPNDMSLVGGSLFFEAVSIDVALPYPIATVNTSGLEVVLGN